MALTEINNLRTRTMKVFQKSPGIRISRCHIGNIHYPDSSKLFQNIDTTLLTQAGGFYQDKCFYNCEIPLRADGNFVWYNRDHYFNLKLVGANAVGYTSIPGVWGDIGKGYRYKDAFGSGIHFEVIAKNMVFEKRICFEKPPPDPNKDFVFEYEIIDAPDTLEFKDNMTGLATVIDRNKTAAQAVKLENKITQIYSSTGKYKSLIHFPMCYDSNSNDRVRLPVKILFYSSGGKTYLRKIIPKEIFKGAVYPVYADDPVRYDPPAGDGALETAYNSSWDTIHDASAAAAAYYDIGGVDSGIFWNNSSAHRIMRGFIPVDTSGIPDGDAISAAVMYVWVYNTDNDDNDGDDWMNIVGATNQASTASLVVGDHDQCGAIDDPTEWAARIDIGSISTGAYNQFTFNSTGRAAIDKTGVTMAGFREGHDCLDNVPTISGNWNGNRVSWYESSYTGTAQDPYLDVTHAAGGETYVKIILTAIDLTDPNKKLMTSKRPFLESIDLKSSNKKTLTFKRMLFSNINFIDSIKRAFTFKKHIFETIDIISLLQRKITTTLKKYIFDSIGLLASNKKNMSYKRQTISVSNLADSIKRLFTAKRLTFASIGLDSLVGRNMTMKRSLYGKEDLSDSNKRLFSFKRLIYGAIDLIDSNITKVTTALKKFIHETINIVEFIDEKVSTTIKQIISSTINMIDSIKRSISLKRYVISSLSLLDTNKRNFVYKRIVQASVGVVESLKKGMTYKRIIQSVVSLLDSCNKIIAAISGLIKAIFDSINIADSEKRLINFKRIILSVVSIPGLLIRKITYKRMLYSVSNLYEAIARQRPLKKIISETISIIDSITHSIGVTVDVTILKIRQFLFDNVLRFFKFSDKTTTFTKKSDIHKMKRDKK